VFLYQKKFKYYQTILLTTKTQIPVSSKLTACSQGTAGLHMYFCVCRYYVFIKLEFDQFTQVLMHKHISMLINYCYRFENILQALSRSLGFSYACISEHYKVQTTENALIHARWCDASVQNGEVKHNTCPFWLVVRSPSVIFFVSCLEHYLHKNF